MPSSYALGDHFEEFMSDLIESGRYNSKSEILRDGLRIIEDREKSRALKFDALKAAIEEGLNSGEAVPAASAFSELKSRYEIDAS